jgi:hypothetical protein
MHVCMCVCVCMYVCMYVCVCVSMYVFVRMFACLLSIYDLNERAVLNYFCRTFVLILVRMCKEMVDRR